jgi:crotonobetainyl-CoA:carnitine CoA-transferase CaiB-like acyl-CoA transferase
VRILPNPTAASSAAILHGITVVELATVIAAPAACALLCDMGATVIKVEAPTGDPWRVSGLPLQKSDTAEYTVAFENNNRGKQSVILDLKTAGGLAALRALLKVPHRGHACAQA